MRKKLQICEQPGCTPFCHSYLGPSKNDPLFLHIVTECDYDCDCDIIHVFKKEYKTLIQWYA